MRPVGLRPMQVGVSAANPNARLNIFLLFFCWGSLIHPKLHGLFQFAQSATGGAVLRRMKATYGVSPGERRN
jgi:hypothetical protein